MKRNGTQASRCSTYPRHQPGLCDEHRQLRLFNANAMAEARFQKFLSGRIFAELAVCHTFCYLCDVRAVSSRRWCEFSNCKRLTSACNKLMMIILAIWHFPLPIGLVAQQLEQKQGSLKPTRLHECGLWVVYSVNSCSNAHRHDVHELACNIAESGLLGDFYITSDCCHA